MTTIDHPFFTIKHLKKKKRNKKKETLARLQIYQPPSFHCDQKQKTLNTNFFFQLPPF